ncbi:hypothetical protein [Beggiatoa leptomitoformis]|uniref:Transglycosylase SLT domain-containing protein n=1 Tax=Beggiatoa leptomitoformis TaxID=288004 RepID=A0A2N9YB87_9GAMM|nr:hypothetical protein [Beggiatoa leptomitoformis]AUI67730.1 hypothetical protein BLE401_02810 [Beggiatoa leptomitoformis]QGX03513.1 hypothetical protein AL038_03220 [Beggiatoa leptomitoformis]
MDKPSSPFFNFFRKIFDSRETSTTPTTSTPTTQAGRFPTTYDSNNTTMLRQLTEAKKYITYINEAVRLYPFLTPAILAGIGSRESHWGLALTPPTPAGRGDFARRAPRGGRTTPEPPDGGGYGRGLMQIDYDWHEFARVGNWQSPRENILYACKVLDESRRFFQQRVNLRDADLLRATIAAYNGGATATLNAINGGQDIDANTTGKDYSKDVLNRAGWFQLQGWK